MKECGFVLPDGWIYFRDVVGERKGAERFYRLGKSTLDPLHLASHDFYK